MARLLLGAPVAAALNESGKARTAALRKRGVMPTLCIVRCGEKSSDMAYEKGACKRAAEVGVAVVKREVPETVAAEELTAVLKELSADDSVHGVLLLRPLPPHLKHKESEICNVLDAAKDVDGCTDLSAAGVFLGKKTGFPPCTAQACMEILDHYRLDCRGKRAVVIGRSPVVGRPAGALFLSRDATVTVCHTKTRDIAAVAKEADILLSATGVKNSVTGEFVKPGAILLDVSVNWDKTRNEGRGGITGDVCWEEVETLVGAITPVPGGVGAVTTAVLMSHVLSAAENQTGK